MYFRYTLYRFLLSSHYIVESPSKTTVCVRLGDCSFDTPCINFYELLVISLSLLPLCETQTRNWQSQNVASMLATLWGCSLIDTFLFALEFAVNTDSRCCHMQYKISGQRPKRSQVLWYIPRSTLSTTEIQKHCCKLRYKYFIIEGLLQKMKTRHFTGNNP